MAGRDRASPLRDGLGEAAAAAVARREVAESDLLAEGAEASLDRLSCAVAGSAGGGAAADAADFQASERRSRFSAMVRIQAGKYLPEPGVGETSVLLYCAERQIAALHRADPETWHPAALAEAFPLTEAAARQLLKEFAELRWACDIRRRDAPVIERVWPSVLRPATAASCGLGWLRADGKLRLLQFAAGNPDLAHCAAAAAARGDDDDRRPAEFAAHRPGQFERLVADYYQWRRGQTGAAAGLGGQPGFLVEAEEAEAAAPAAEAHARETLADLLAELGRLEQLSQRPRGPDGRPLPEPYQFERRLEGLDFASKFRYDK